MYCRRTTCVMNIRTIKTKSGNTMCSLAFFFILYGFVASRKINRIEKVMVHPITFTAANRRQRRQWEDCRKNKSTILQPIYYLCIQTHSRSRGSTPSLSEYAFTRINSVNMVSPLIETQNNLLYMSSLYLFWLVVGQIKSQELLQQFKERDFRVRKRSF